MNKYLNVIIVTAQKLRDIKFDGNEEWIGPLLLAGSPKSYKPIIIEIESFGAAISGDFIKIKLLKDVKNISEEKNVCSFS